MTITWRWSWKRSTTFFAGVGLGSSVHVNVELQFVRLRESFSTILTHARFLFSVSSTHVTVMSRVWGKGSSAVPTLEGLLTAMLTDVCAQNRRSSESLDTVWTLVRSLTAVNSHMFVEAGWLWETFAAHCTLMRTMLLMYMQNVNAKTITLVKWSVTHAAGEFSVSLINTARVFKVTVTVIFVGKYFTAPFTGKTSKQTYGGM